MVVDLKRISLLSFCNRIGGIEISLSAIQISAYNACNSILQPEERICGSIHDAAQFLIISEHCRSKMVLWKQRRDSRELHEPCSELLVYRAQHTTVCGNASPCEPAGLPRRSHPLLKPRYVEQRRPTSRDTRSFLTSKSSVITGSDSMLRLLMTLVSNTSTSSSKVACSPRTARIRIARAGPCSRDVANNPFVILEMRAAMSGDFSSFKRIPCHCAIPSVSRYSTFLNVFSPASGPQSPYWSNIATIHLTSSFVNRSQGTSNAASSPQMCSKSSKRRS